jgi:hypothetical protein
MPKKIKTRSQSSTSNSYDEVDPSRKLDQTTHTILSEQRQVRRPARVGSVQQQFLHLKGVVNDNVLSLQSASAARSRERMQSFPSMSDEFRAVLEVGSINYQLFTPQEQEAVIAHYRSLIASLHYPIQILIRVLPVDLEPYLRAIAEQATRRYAQQALLWKQQIQRATTSQGSLRQNSYANVGAVGGPGLHGNSAPIEDNPITSREPRRDASVPDAGYPEDQPDMAPFETAEVMLRLAQDHMRYVRSLAAQRGLLERHFYVVLQATEIDNFWGSAVRGSAPLRWVASRFGEKRRGGSLAQAWHRQTVACQQLDLRVNEIGRQLAAMRLPVRRLAGDELVHLYYSCLTPERAAAAPITREYLDRIGLPVIARAPSTWKAHRQQGRSSGSAKLPRQQDVAQQTPRW